MKTGNNAISFTLPDSNSLSLKNTLECGQCFRWGKNTDHSYTGIARNIPAIVSEQNGIITVKTNQQTGFDVKEFWTDYFDLRRDYSAILQSFRQQFSKHPFTLAALKYGAGLRILQQDAWEMLISYITSQQMKIPRISALIEELAKRKGRKIQLEEHTLYTFPAADKLAELSEADLKEIGFGYRAPYIAKVAQDFANKELMLEALRSLSTAEARKYLRVLPGVGEKVANCVCLFGFGKTDAFPVDTWIEKANKEFYDGKLTAELFGENAGIAQQYIFYYIRSTQA